MSIYTFRINTNSTSVALPLDAIEPNRLKENQQARHYKVDFIDGITGNIVWSSGVGSSYIMVASTGSTYIDNVYSSTSTGNKTPAKITTSVSNIPKSYNYGNYTMEIVVSVDDNQSIPSDYLGRPTGIVGLTSITPKILISRNDSAPYPVPVMVSASETVTNLGTLQATDLYNDLTYEWDFGDPSSTETFTNHKTGDTINTNNGWTTPEAAHVYRSDGSYTITLTVTGYNASGQKITGTTTTLLTCGQYYVFNGNATGGTFKLIFNGSGETATIDYSVAGNNNQDADTMIAALIAAYPSTLNANNIRRTIQNTIEFYGDLAGQAAVLTADFSGLTGTTKDPEVRAERTSGSSASFTVIDRSGMTEQYWDSAAAGGGDGTIGSPKNDYASLLTFLKSGSNLVAHVKYGSSWTMTTSRFQGQKQSNVILEAYGTPGAKPKLICDDTNHRWRFDLEYGGAIGGHYVFSNIQFEDTATTASTGAVRVLGTASNAAGAGTKGSMSTVKDILLDRVDYVATGTNIDTSFVSMSLTTRGAMQGGPFYIWDCDADHGIADNDGMLTANEQWICIVGGTTQGGNADPVFNHFIYENAGNHSLVAFVNFTTAIQMSYCINCNVKTTSPDKLWVTVYGCNLSGSIFGVDLANSNNDETKSHIDNALIDSCVFANLTAAVYPNTARKVTVRNCDIYSSSVNVAQIRGGGGNAQLVFNIYNCRVWVAENRCFDINTENGYMHNNIMVSEDALTGAIRVEPTGDSIDFVGTWDVDGNQWYAPNATSPFHYDGSLISLASWNVLAAVGTDTEANPGWTDPANGDFS